MIIALDPGDPVVYGAVFDRGVCVKLREFTREVMPIDRTKYAQAVCEEPSILGAPNAADMVQVLISGAIVASALSCTVILHSVPKWKGSIAKPVHHYRVWEHLTKAEREFFPANALEVINKACAKYAQTGKVTGYSQKWHNHLDALALGMFHLGRIKRGGEKGTT